jgi:hypothetical protein
MRTPRACGIWHTSRVRTRKRAPGPHTRQPFFGGSGDASARQQQWRSRSRSRSGAAAAAAAARTPAVCAAAAAVAQRPREKQWQQQPRQQQWRRRDSRPHNWGAASARERRWEGVVRCGAGAGVRPPRPSPPCFRGAPRCTPPWPAPRQAFGWRLMDGRGGWRRARAIHAVLGWVAARSPAHPPAELF